MGHLGRNHIDPSCLCLKPLYRLYNEFISKKLIFYFILFYLKKYGVFLVYLFLL